MFYILSYYLHLSCIPQRELELHETNIFMQILYDKPAPYYEVPDRVTVGLVTNAMKKKKRKKEKRESTFKINVTDAEEMTLLTIMTT